VPFLLAIFLTLLSLSNVALAQPSLDAGKKIYDVCAGCHGFLAEGNELVGAPRLSGLETWYLSRQMRNFSAGIRGAAPGDTHGQRMAIMAGAVGSDRALEDLAAYLGTLPQSRSAPTVAGDAAAGGGQFAACAACHGLRAEGNAQLSSPALVTLDDWYVVEQLRLFAGSLRGTHAEDVYGQQMRAVAGTVADEQARNNLASYINSLSQ
jgi:cytochrome c oxidase subunit 2